MHCPLDYHGRLEPVMLTNVHTLSMPYFFVKLKLSLTLAYNTSRAPPTSRPTAPIPRPIAHAPEPDAHLREPEIGRELTDAVCEPSAAAPAVFALADVEAGTTVFVGEATPLSCAT